MNTHRESGGTSERRPTPGTPPSHDTAPPVHPGGPPPGYPPQVPAPQGIPPQSYSPPGYPPQVPAPQGIPPQNYSPPGYPTQGWPQPGYGPPAYPAPPATTQAATTQPTERGDTVTTVIAWLGATILVLGLVFLTVQAVDHGWLNPDVAVVLAVVICLAVGVGSVSAHLRSPDGPVAPALLSVAVLGLLCDIQVAVTGIDRIPAWAGALLALLTCAVALGVTRWWDRMWPTFLTVVVGGLFLTAATVQVTWSGDDATVGASCLTALGVLGWAVTWSRNQVPVDAAAAVVFVLGAFLVPDRHAPVGLLVAAVVAVAVIGVLSLRPTVPGSGAAVTAAALTRWVPATTVPALLLLNTAAWVTGTSEDRTATAARWCALAIGVLTCAVPVVRQLLVRQSLALPARPPAPVPRYVVPSPAGPVFPGYPAVPGPPPPASTVADASRAALAAGLTALGFSLTSLHANAGTSWWLCVLVLLAAAVVWFSPVLPPVYPWLTGCFTMLAGLHLLVPAWDRHAGTDRWPLWLPALLYLGLGAVVLLREGPLRISPPVRIPVYGVLGVLGTSAVPLIARDVSDTATSFMTGHLLVSVLWMLLGVVLLLRVDARVGLGVALFATAKLVLYDLAALSGLIRVATFILCGLILLACAALRDRGATPERSAPDTSAPEHRGPASP